MRDVHVVTSSLKRKIITRSRKKVTYKVTKNADQSILKFTIIRNVQCKSYKVIGHKKGPNTVIYL